MKLHHSTVVKDMVQRYLVYCVLYGCFYCQFLGENVSELLGQHFILRG